MDSRHLIANYKRWRLECKREDIAYLNEQNENIDEVDARRMILEKAQVLKSISSLSAVMLGFAMISQTNVAIPSLLSTEQLIPFAVLTATSIAAIVIAMLNSTFLLLAVYRYDWTSVHSNSMTFHEYWDKLCYHDWKVAIYSFIYGFFVFLGMQASIGWVCFFGIEGSVIASWLNASITMVTILIVIWLFRRQKLKQKGLLNEQLQRDQQPVSRLRVSSISDNNSLSNISAITGTQAVVHRQASL